MDLAKLDISNIPATFSVIMGGVSYHMTLRYAMDYWAIDLYVGDKPLLTGLPVVCCTDLLYQYQHLFPGQHLMFLDTEIEHSPTYSDIGPHSFLWYWNG